MIPGILIGFALGTFAWFVLFLLLHRPRYTAPTLRRRYRDREQIREQVRGGEQIRSEVGGIDYRFLGQTGEEV